MQPEHKTTGWPPGEPCTHGELHHGSGGFYLMCVACGQQWVAKRRGADRDTDLDHGPSRSCMTPLAGGNGRYVFTLYGRRTDAA